MPTIEPADGTVRVKRDSPIHFLFLATILLGIAAAGVACGDGDSRTEPTPLLTPVPTVTPDVPTVNVVDAFNLEGAARIEVFELAVDGPGYLLRTVISDDRVINALIDALDEELILGSRVRCPENFRLRFFFAGGRMETLGLVCFSEPDLVRGDDSVFGFRDAPVPADFQLAFRTAMAVAPRPDRVASDRIVPLAIAEVIADHPELAEFTNFDYERLDLTPPMTVGASQFAYQSLDWRVEVGWAVVEKPVYQVEVTSLRKGTEWQGQFRDEPVARGLVITPDGPAIADRVLSLVLDRLNRENPALSGLDAAGFHRFDLTTERLVGFSRFGYQNRDWEFEIGWQVVLEPVFSVAARAPGIGFTWEGKVPMSELPDGEGLQPEAM